MRKQELQSTYVWVNVRSKTVHQAVMRNSVSAGCGHFFGQDAKPRRLDRADVHGMFSRGSCYRLRACIVRDGA
eukprot:891860-Pyramimonas_sp.AAC.1